MILTTALTATGIALLIAAAFALAGAFALSRRASKPATPKATGQAVEGVIPRGAAAKGPLGDSFYYGLVTVSALTRSGGTRAPQTISLLNEIRGNPRVPLQADQGTIEVVLADPMSRWAGVPVQDTRLPNLDAHPDLARLAQGRSFPNLIEFSVRVLALREGDRVLVDRASDGTASKVWFGGVEGYRERSGGYQANIARGVRVLVVGGIVGLILGGLLLAAAVTVG